MNARGPWIALSVIAAALVLFMVFVVPRLLQRAPAPAPAAVATADAGSCRVPEKLSLQALPDAENPPLVVIAEGKTRVLIDNEPTFSAWDSPRHFKVGLHSLRAESESGATITTSFRLNAWKPGVLYVADDELVGPVLLRLGAACTSCTTPLVPQQLNFTPRRDKVPYLLTESARSLRANDWAAAGELLRGVPMKERNRPEFLLVSAAFFAQVNQLEDFKQAMAKLSRAQPKAGFSQLLPEWEKEVAAEHARQKQTVLARWNKVTDRYTALVSRYEPQVRGKTEQAARRFEQLSGVFLKAAEQDDLAEQTQVGRAAEELLSELVSTIRAGKPNDCEFQAQVVATALQ